MISVRDQDSFLGQTKPPYGYRLTYCVGTTFSLELECLLQLALNSRGIEKSVTEASELEKFAAIQDFQGRASVFCQSCRIKESQFLMEEARGPKGIRKLLAILDACVMAVPAPGFKASFHPKVWLLRYDGEAGRAPPTFTLLVQSRNLTTSKDWDIAALFSGSLSSVASHRNDSLVEFLERLEQVARPARKHAPVSRAIKDLPYVQFQSIPEFSERWALLYQWPNGVSWSPLDPKDYRELIAVSPFLGKSSKVLGELATVPRFTLITGSRDIATVTRVDGLPTRTYVMEGTREGVWDNTDAGPEQLGLHAKMYLGLRKHSDVVDVFVGSANLTDAALGGRNCEAMVCLQGHLRHLRRFEAEFIYKNPKTRVLHPWLRSFDSLVLAQGGPDVESDPARERLEDLRSKIAQGTFYLNFQKRGQRARLRFSGENPIPVPKEVVARIRLAGTAQFEPLEPLLAGKSSDVTVTSDERTEFLVVSLADGEIELRFVTIACSDLDRSGRTRMALNRLVRGAEDFFQLLGLILAAPITTIPPDSPLPATPGKKRPRPVKRRRAPAPLGKTAFLEPLLLRGMLDPEREKEIEEVVTTFLKGRHPAAQKRLVVDFRTFWHRYCKASAALRRHG